MFDLALDDALIIVFVVMEVTTAVLPRTVAALPIDLSEALFAGAADLVRSLDELRDLFL